MRWLGGLAVIVVCGLAPACDCNHHTGNGPDAEPCNPPAPCVTGEVCRYDTCVPDPTPCSAASDCVAATYCNLDKGECLPWGVGPGGASDPTCKRDPVP